MRWEEGAAPRWGQARPRSGSRASPTPGASAHLETSPQPEPGGYPWHGPGCGSWPWGDVIEMEKALGEAGVPFWAQAGGGADT